jgi:hypothetical protein
LEYSAVWCAPWRLLLYYEMSEPSVFAAQSAKFEDRLVGERHAFLTANDDAH